MHWQTDEDKQALADFRAHNRKASELKQELWEFKQIQHGHGDAVTSWALQMIKSIEHELHQLES
jgi:hypothetical protein